MLHFFRAFKPLAVDFLSTIIFVAIYAATGSVKLGIALGIVAGAGQIAFLYFRKMPIAGMQWMSLALVIVLGSASLLTADPRFVMVKPSIGTFAIGCVMLKSGWQARYMPPIISQHVASWVLVFWGYAWAVLMFALTAANLYVAFKMGLKAWAWYSAFVPLSAQLGLFVTQYFSLRLAVGRAMRARGKSVSANTPA